MLSLEEKQRRREELAEQGMFLSWSDADDEGVMSHPKEAPFKLHKNQRYVFDIARVQGYPVEMLGHAVETETCMEKAKLLTDRFGSPWDPVRVVKALYFHPVHAEGMSDSMHYICVVTPETGKRVDLDGLLQRHGLGSVPYGNGKVPKGMAMGTCTPFPRYTQVGTDRSGSIERFLVFDFPELDDKTVDVSVGGNCSESRKTSMHLPYKAIYGILAQQFGKEVAVKTAPAYLH